MFSLVILFACCYSFQKMSSWWVSFFSLN